MGTGCRGGGSSCWGCGNAHLSRDGVWRTRKLPLSSQECLPQLGWGVEEEAVASRVVRVPTPVGLLPSARGGRGRQVGKGAAVVALSFAHHSTMVIHFYGSPGFLHEHSQLQIYSLLFLQVVSSQPTAVLSLGLPSKHHIPAPSPHAHWRTAVSGWGMQGCGKDHLCRSHSVLPATDRLLHSPMIAPETPLLT